MADPKGSANFLLVAGCCFAIDYLAHIYASKGSDEAKATVFIDTFLAPINQRYGEVGFLIRKCFRQGTVHRSWPKRIVLEDGTAEAITGAGGEASDPRSHHNDRHAPAKSPRFHLRAHLKCRLANAPPDPDFRYFSSAIARRSSENSTMTSMIQGLPSAVWGTRPAL